jgi:hypothetical protein
MLPTRLRKESWELEGERNKIDTWPEEFGEWSEGAWSITPDTCRWGKHRAVLPEDLIRRLLLFFTYRGTTILDPFGGTGTVAVVAKRNRRRYIHIDQSEEYCEVTHERWPTRRSSLKDPTGLLGLARSATRSHPANSLGSALLSHERQRIAGVRPRAPAPFLGHVLPSGSSRKSDVGEGIR